MPDEYEAERRALKEFMDIHKISGRRLSGGTSPSTVSHFVNGHSKAPKETTFKKWAKEASDELGRPVTVDELLGRQDLSSRAAASSSDATSANLMPSNSQGLQPYSPVRPETEDDVPFFATEIGQRGETLMSKKKAGKRRRTNGLYGRDDVFCFHVRTGEMANMFRPGALVVVEDRLPKAEDGALIELGDDDKRGMRRMILREVVSIEDDRLRVRQFKPPRTTTILRKDIVKIYRVMPLSEIM